MHEGRFNTEHRIDPKPDSTFRFDALAGHDGFRSLSQLSRFFFYSGLKRSRCKPIDDALRKIGFNHVMVWLIKPRSIGASVIRDVMNSRSGLSFTV
jgi:hypothetical protein